MAFTLDQLQALEEAIASGATLVKYIDREVRYNTMEEMWTLRNRIRGELGLVDNNNGRRYARFSKGLR